MIYIICPTHIATGGTELLHQLHFELTSIGVKSSMFYVGKLEGSPVEKKFSHKYNPIIASNIIDDYKNIIICSETHFARMFKYKKIKKVCWRLSVDNFCGLVKKGEPLSKKIKHYLIFVYFKYHAKKYIHLVQSEYARRFVHLTFHIHNSSIYTLSDYLNDDYLNFDSSKESFAKEKQILYNPRKGLEFTMKIIALLPNIKWIPLQGYSNFELKNLYLHSKLYIDFGNHPGKDRIPREAAICGCCIITGKDGAAENDIDIPINPEYKFSANEENLNDIKNRILECLNNYDLCSQDFISYRKIILNEKKEFIKQVKALFLNGLIS